MAVPPQNGMNVFAAGGIRFGGTNGISPGVWPTAYS
jgi:hypothetical protein